MVSAPSSSRIWSPRHSPDAEQEWIARAGEHFDGAVVVARDLLALDVGAAG